MKKTWATIKIGWATKNQETENQAPKYFSSPGTFHNLLVTDVLFNSSEFHHTCHRGWLKEGSFQ
jgi:hypothetical protein